MDSIDAAGGAVGRSLTYTGYLKVDELLSLQRPRSDEHDELLFVVIHQVYELWFKQLLHEAARLQHVLDDGDAHAALGTLTRMLAILKTVVSQVDVLETLTPLQFAGFRDRLESASGFQSAQFRELEAVLGRRDRRILDPHPPGPARDRIEAALDRPSLYATFLAFAGVPPQARDDAGATHAAAVVRALEQVYRGDPLKALVCERMLDLDEGLQEWRYRHVTMVRRTIGDRAGTGGSSGAAYLASTVRPMFAELWAVRDSF